MKIFALSEFIHNWIKRLSRCSKIQVKLGDLELSVQAFSAAVIVTLPKQPIFLRLQWLMATRRKKTKKAAKMNQQIQNGMKRRKQMMRTVVKMQHEPAQSYPVTVLKLSKNSAVLPFAGGATVYCCGGICIAGCGGATGRGCCMFYG